ncbi:hypothetical protein KIH39_09825 [Telmatocola sphagniphila]|uniref:Uncharacterized protein n=1 Tax=Telmatocola sphagniphila TaxID=1123043 RepID=A0A8E6B972_9BACT|nr:hypothetical protein [Telmatocola sphagniphila]QVL34182.1 hypothetical protein KIH39_09825 [Telmatocola sphagniphila]
MVKVVRVLSIGVGMFGLSLSTGCQVCDRYHEAVDPCAMERYNSTARANTMSLYAAQVHNGHILDQTIFNYNFEAETDKLNVSGLDKLDQLVRRRPAPDSRLFLATATDIPYNAENPTAFSEKQRDLDAKRIAAIKKYLASRTAGRPTSFEVYIHDPSDPSISAISARNATTAQLSNYSGGGGAAGGAAGGGATGGGGGGGGATGGNTNNNTNTGNTGNTGNAGNTGGTGTGTGVTPR